MDKVEIFINDEFGEVRTLVIENEIWFVGKDVAEALGYSNASKAVSTHCKRGKKEMLEVADSQNGNVVKTQTTLIPEGDVYRLITKSHLPKAEKFESWVFDDVLPTIRKSGGYINNSDLFVNTYFGTLPDTEKELVRGLVINIENQQKKNIALNNENDLLTQKTLEWSDRPLINSLVRAYAKTVGGDFGKAWIFFKREILYKYG